MLWNKLIYTLKMPNKTKLSEAMDLTSILSNLPTYDDAPKNHKNLPYPMLQIVSGKSGSGKTHLVLKELLTPGFLDYKELYVLSPNINTKEYQFLKHGFKHNLNKEILLEVFSYFK